MADWPAPRRPAAHAEEMLVTGILDGTFAPGSTLPAERELAARLGITRPTLREALQRLHGDGWISIRQGKPTRVNDVWREGGLRVLSAAVRYGRCLPDDFVTHLLEVRLAMAPAYTRAAVARAAPGVVKCLEAHVRLEDEPDAFSAFDWRLHHSLTLLSGNPVYTLILNGFAGFYEQMARLYFAQPGARAVSRAFYADLLAAARAGDVEAAAAVVEAVMRRSIELWDEARNDT
jgi:GntR family negative regulator for fad regulon and positive regulator of fabA